MRHRAIATTPTFLMKLPCASRSLPVPPYRSAQRNWTATNLEPKSSCNLGYGVLFRLRKLSYGMDLRYSTGLSSTKRNPYDPEHDRIR